MRTIIISDAHGHPELIEAALADAGFNKGVDRFVYAGDVVDRGPDSAKCFQLVDELADIALLGNHDVAVMLGASIEFDERSMPLMRPLIDRLQHDADRWRFAAAVEGFLVTHAGLSRRFAEESSLDLTCAPEALAAQIDRILRADVLWSLRGWIGSGPEFEPSCDDMNGPLWWRPHTKAPDEVPPGLKQIIGHTPLGSSGGSLEALGIWQVDSAAGENTPSPGRCRYAIVENGDVRVIERPDRPW